MATFTVMASNEQGATTGLVHGNEFSSVTAAEKAARAELGKGWAVHIYETHYNTDGEWAGKDEVKTFRIRR